MPKYKIADLIMDFCPQYPYTAEQCEPYRTDDSLPADIVVEKKSDYSYEAQMLPNFPTEYLENTYLYRQICTAIIDFDAFLLHSSTVMVDGEAYIFTAPSGTGKSTHTRLWQSCFGPERAKIINDDKPIVRKKDVFYVYGTPWCGKHMKNINTSCPIKGVCFLKRGQKNTIRKLGKNEVIVPLMNQIHRTSDTHYMDKLLSLLDDFLEQTSFYELHCDISAEAVVTSYEGMSGKKVVRKTAEQ